MNLEEINAEKEKAFKDLSEIQMALSDGRVAFEKMKEEQEKYFELRENEAVERIRAVFDTMKEVFTEINTNADDLRRFKSDLIEFFNKVTKLSKEARAASGNFQAIILNGNEMFDKKVEEISLLKNDLVEERKSIAEDRNALKEETQKLAEDIRAMMDKRNAFERAWKELEDKEKAYNKKVKKLKE